MGCCWSSSARGSGISCSNGWGGTAHIVYGRAAFDAVLDLANAVGSGVANLNGEFEGHNVGYDLAPAGDVNHDGYDDLLIGAPTFLVSSEPGGVDDTGYAYLVLGSRDIGRPQLLGDYPIGWIADLIFAGTTIGERVGLSVAGAGYCGPTWSRVKSNGGGTPGRGDVLLIGTGIDTVHSHAYWIDRETQQSSVGQPVPLKRRRLLVELGNGANRIGSFTITGPAGSALGRWVHGPADLDGDGLSDLLLGAPYQLDYSDPAGDGRVHVHRGQ